MTTEAARAYVAGLFDGEGYVGAFYSKSHKRMFYKAEITNTNIACLEFCRATYGGTIRKLNPSEKHPTWQTYYRWVVRTAIAEAMIRRSNWYLSEAEKIYQDVKKLNARGPIGQVVLP